MKGKRSFLLFCDQQGLFDQLPDEQAGKLIKLIFSYVNDEDPAIDDLLLKVAFQPIKLQLKRDLDRWKNIVDRNRTNGAKGGRPKNPKNPENPVGSLVTQENPDEPKKADTDTDTDTDTVTDTKPEVRGEFDNSPPPTKSKPATDSGGLQKSDGEQQGGKKSMTFEDKYRGFIKHFNYLKGREAGSVGRFQEEDKSRRQFKVIIKKYNSAEIGEAIKSMFNDQHHIDNGFKYATPELLTRPEKFAMFLEMSR